MSYVEERCDHAVEIGYLEVHDGRLTYMEVEIHHPQDCQVGWQEEPKCALGYGEQAVGLHEFLGLAWGPERWDEPCWKLLNHALTTGRDRLPLCYRFSSGTDYWGEYDEDFEWWVR